MLGITICNAAAKPQCWAPRTQSESRRGCASPVPPSLRAVPVPKPGSSPCHPSGPGAAGAAPGPGPRCPGSSLGHILCRFCCKRDLFWGRSCHETRAVPAQARLAVRGRTGSAPGAAGSFYFILRSQTTEKPRGEGMPQEPRLLPLPPCPAGSLQQGQVPDVPRVSVRGTSSTRAFCGFKNKKHTGRI